MCRSEASSIKAFPSVSSAFVEFELNPSVFFAPQCCSVGRWEHSTCSSLGEITLFLEHPREVISAHFQVSTTEYGSIALRKRQRKDKHHDLAIYTITQLYIYSVGVARFVFLPLPFLIFLKWSFKPRAACLFLFWPFGSFYYVWCQTTNEQLSLFDDSDWSNRCKNTLI